MTRKKKSRGLQSIWAGLTAAASTVVAAAPQIVPFVPDRYARTAAIVTGVSAAIVAGFSQPPRSSSRSTDYLPNSGVEHHGEL